MKRKKIINLSIIVVILTIMLTYKSNIENIPNNIVLFEKGIPNIITLAGIKIESKETGSFNIDAGRETKETISKDEESIKLNVKLFGIKVKEISADIINNLDVVPLGNLVGIKLYTKGILVVGTSEIYGKDNKIYKPCVDSGIKEGDNIISIDDNNINSTDELIDYINSSNGREIKITYIHNKEILETKIKPIQTDLNEYKIGLWVRDMAAGIGTATFYDKKTKRIATLGHGIQDIDTEELIDISGGEFTTTDIISIQKGTNGEAGKIQGTVENQKKIGEITSNTYYGVYGIFTDLYSNNETIKVALRNEIQLGDAKILCELDNKKVEAYKIKIKKIYVNNNSNNKSMLLEITDRELLNKTGGIIQGMSGSPIIQNGKIIGALTHVLVQNPREGYAVFADQMIKQMKE